MRYKADEGKKVYLEHRRNCRKQYRGLASVRFLQYVVEHFKSEDKWSLDASYGKALGGRQSSAVRKWSAPRPSTTTWISVCLPIKNIDSAREAPPQHESEKSS